MNFGELLMANSMADFEGGEDPDNPISREMRILAKKNLRYDNRSSLDVTRSAAKTGGISPALLLASAFGEGMNKAIAKPDEISQSYLDNVTGDDLTNFPVDGFYNYGLDTFGGRFKDLKTKGFLPQDWDETRFKSFEALNEKKQKTSSAAFRNNEDALIAKSAIIRDEMELVKGYAKKNNIPLDDDSLNYFTLASYNAGFGNAQAMLDEFNRTPDKKKFIKEGLTTKKGVHKNISPRLENMMVAQSLLDEKIEP